MEMDPEVAKLRFAAQVLPALLGKLGVSPVLARGIATAVNDPTVVADNGEIDLIKFDQVIKTFVAENKQSEPPIVITCGRCGKIAVIDLQN